MLVRRIPRSQVVTYGQNATYSGSPRAARPVGRARLMALKTRHKRYGSGRTHRGHIANRVGIKERCLRGENRLTLSR